MTDVNTASAEARAAEAEAKALEERVNAELREKAAAEKAAAEKAAAEKAAAEKAAAEKAAAEKAAAEKAAAEKAAAEKAAAEKAAAEKAAAEKAAKGKKGPKTALFHVVGPGSLRFNSERLAAGETLELTEEQAEELGSVVAPGRAPEMESDFAERKAGVYVVKGPGFVRVEGKRVEAGTELKLSAVQARSLGASVSRKD